MSEFTTVVFSPGQRIFNAGDVAQHLFYIQQGVVQLLDANGQVIGEIGDGESFGEQAFLKGGVRGASAQAKSEVRCIQIANEEAILMLSEASPLWVPVFEALLLQQNMHNALRMQMAS